MADSECGYLRIPRDATFPTLPVPTDFEEYDYATISVRKIYGRKQEKNIIFWSWN